MPLETLARRAEPGCVYTLTPITLFPPNRNNLVSLYMCMSVQYVFALAVFPLDLDMLLLLLVV